MFSCTWAVGCQKFVQYIRMLCPGRFILVESVDWKIFSKIICIMCFYFSWFGVKNISPFHFIFLVLWSAEIKVFFCNWWIIADDLFNVQCFLLLCYICFIWDKWIIFLRPYIFFWLSAIFSKLSTVQSIQKI